MVRSAFAPAKVNLFLHVGPPAADGYHPICSLMAFADVGDRLSLSPGEALSFEIHGPFAEGLSGGEDNLVVRAVRALLRAAGRDDGLSLSLDKQLPVASGLGGGSSDAGAALRLVRAALALDVDDARLEAIAGSLGADGAACLWGRPVLAQGRGEQLSPAPALPQLHAVLVNPRVPVSTPAVYRALDAAGRFGDVAPPPLPPAFESPEELAAWLALQGNDLEAPAIAIAPEVGDALELLAGEAETLLARVSGSGGTCFALCAGDIEAEGLAARLAALRPAWWIRSCRLGGALDL